MKTNLGTLFEDTFEEEKKLKNKMPLWAARCLSTRVK